MFLAHTQSHSSPLPHFSRCIVTLISGYQLLHSPYALPLRAHMHLSTKKGNMDQMIEMCRSQTHMVAFGISQRMAHERNRQDRQVQWQQQNQHSQLANRGSLSHGHLECFASSLGYPMQHGTGAANGMTVPNAHFAALGAKTMAEEVMSCVVLKRFFAFNSAYKRT